MLYEKHFECKTRGLVQGIPILNSNIIGGGSLIFPGKRNSSKFLNKKEFFISDDLVDLRPSINSIKTYKIIIRSRESKEEIWVRPFVNINEAFIVWTRLLNIDLERVQQAKLRFFNMPSVYFDGELEYLFATVETFTSVGTTTWTSSARPYIGNAISVLVQGGGSGGASGASGSYYGGGGGAGGYRTNTAYAVSKSTGYTVTVGGGSGIQSYGGSSVFGTISATYGGVGGNASIAATAGGSGGGGSYYTTTPGSGNLGGYSPSEGNRGGYYYTGGQGGPGGGAGAAGSDVGPGYAAGVSNSLSGASVEYGRGGNGYPSGVTPLANGGYGGDGGYTGAGGSSGTVVLSYTFANYAFNMPMLGM